MSFLDQIKKKPEKERKRILWISVFFVAFILIIFLFLNLKYSLSKINFSDFKGPQINTEELKKAKEEIKKLREDLGSFKKENEQSKEKQK